MREGIRYKVCSGSWSRSAYLSDYPSLKSMSSEHITIVARAGLSNRERSNTDQISLCAAPFFCWYIHLWEVIRITESESCYEALDLHKGSGVSMKRCVYRTIATESRILTIEKHVLQFLNKATECRCLLAPCLAARWLWCVSECGLGVARMA